MKINRTKKNISFFIVGALVLLPFDSVPGIFPSDYRPVSFLLILPLFVHLTTRILIRLKLEKVSFYLVLSFLYFVTVSFLVTILRGFELAGFFDFIITGTIGVATFLVFRYCFIDIRQTHQSNDEYVQAVFRYLSFGYMILVVIGLIELVSAYTPILPDSIKEQLNFAIGGRFSANRLHITSGEPAWAARQALFGLPIMLVTKGRKSIWTIALIILIFFTLSLEGLLVLAVSFCVFVLYRNWKEKSGSILSSAFKIGFAAILMVLLLMIGRRILFGHEDYFFLRLERIRTLNLTNIDYSKLIYFDESVFIRVAYPTIGFLAFVDNPILGVGGGNYRHHFSDYLLTHFPAATKLDFKKVKNDLKLKNHQGKNLYTRLLGEFGIVGLTLFFLFVRLIFRKIQRAEFKNEATRTYLVYWVIICLVAFMQFDSLSYLNFWILASFLLALLPEWRVQKPTRTV